MASETTQETSPFTAGQWGPGEAGSLEEAARASAEGGHEGAQVGLGRQSRAWGCWQKQGTDQLRSEGGSTGASAPWEPAQGVRDRPWGGVLQQQGSLLPRGSPVRFGSSQPLVGVKGAAPKEDAGHGECTGPGAGTGHGVGADHGEQRSLWF